MLVKSKAKENEAQNVEDLVKEPFNIKAVTHIMATPDEVSGSITDPTFRPMWDPAVVSVVKQGIDVFQVSYQGGYTENVKFDFQVNK